MSGTGSCSGARRSRRAGERDERRLAAEVSAEAGGRGWEVGMVSREKGA